MSIVDTILGTVGLLLMAGVGGVLLVVGWCLVVGVVKIAREMTESAQGRVVGHEKSDDDEGTYYAPLVEFEAGGQFHRIKGKLARSGRPEHKCGAAVKVAYPPGRPEDGQLGRWEGWWIAAGVALVGSVFTLVPVVKLILLMWR